MYVYVTHVCGYLQIPGEGVKSPITGVTDDCGLTCRTQIPIFFKYSYLWSHLSSLMKVKFHEGMVGFYFCVISVSHPHVSWM